MGASNRKNEAEWLPNIANGVEWDGEVFDGSKLPLITGGGAVGQSMGFDVFDFHEQKQQQHQQQHQQQRDKHFRAPM